jgi:hypothetical protein
VEMVKIAAGICFLPHRQARTRCPPDFEYFGVWASPCANPLEEIKNQRLHRIDHRNSPRGQCIVLDARGGATRAVHDNQRRRVGGVAVRSAPDSSDGMDSPAHFGIKVPAGVAWCGCRRMTRRSPT